MYDWTFALKTYEENLLNGTLILPQLGAVGQVLEIAS